MNITIIGGTWDRGVGKESKIVNSLGAVVASTYPEDQVLLMNGGNILELRTLILDGNDQWHASDVVLWMPNISNAEEKILPFIKRNYPEKILIQSKRVIEKEYGDFALVKRMLASHSALLLKIEKNEGTYLFGVMDPLGNSWCEKESLLEATKALFDRAHDIHSMNRMRSVTEGPREDFSLDPAFLETVRSMGVIFDEKIQAVNPERYLGNASTRCCHGFPSARSDRNTVFVSQRNVDKTMVSEESFVEVKIEEGKVVYKGEKKPSVDTPVQVMLYEELPEINYMIHGHCYVKGAPMTPRSVPCGFLEEKEEVLKTIGKEWSVDLPDVFSVNLRGHGCLIMGKRVPQKEEFEFVSRKMPEKQI